MNMAGDTGYGTFGGNHGSRSHAKLSGRLVPGIGLPASRALFSVDRDAFSLYQYRGLLTFEDIFT
jgi:hypothetical protein